MTSDQDIEGSSPSTCNWEFKMTKDQMLLCNVLAEVQKTEMELTDCEFNEHINRTSIRMDQLMRVLMLELEHMEPSPGLWREYITMRQNEGTWSLDNKVPVNEKLKEFNIHRFIK